MVAQLAGVGALARGQCDSEKSTDLVITTTLEASHDEKMEARTLANAANDKRGSPPSLRSPNAEATRLASRRKKERTQRTPPVL